MRYPHHHRRRIGLPVAWLEGDQHLQSFFFCGCDEGVSVWDRFFPLLVQHTTRIAYLHVFSIIRIFFSFVSGIFLSGGGGRGGWGLGNEETDSCQSSFSCKVTSKYVTVDHLSSYETTRGIISSHPHISQLNSSHLSPPSPTLLPLHLLPTLNPRLPLPFPFPFPIRPLPTRPRPRPLRAAATTAALSVLGHDTLKLRPQRLDRRELVAHLFFSRFQSASLTARGKGRGKGVGRVEQTVITASSERFSLLMLARTCSKLCSQGAGWGQ